MHNTTVYIHGIFTSLESSFWLFFRHFQKTVTVYNVDPLFLNHDIVYSVLVLNMNLWNLTGCWLYVYRIAKFHWNFNYFRIRITGLICNSYCEIQLKLVLIIVNNKALSLKINSINSDCNKSNYIYQRKIICKLYFFYKKIHYFYSDAGTHSQCRIFTILNSTF